MAFKTLLVETAKELWRRNNPGRERLPKNYEDGLRIKVFELKPGSVAVPLERELTTDPGLYPPAGDELDEAAILVPATIAAVADDAPLPERFPRRLLHLFDDYGKTLGADDSILLRPAAADRQAPARYNLAVRERLSAYADGHYEDQIDLTGEVRAADLDGHNFTLRLPDDTKVQGKFSSEQEAVIVGALQEHETTRARVRGRGLFAQADGRLKRILSIVDVAVLPAGEPEYDSTTRPIWEALREIGDSLPPEVLADVPRDLSINIDHYLYGARKVGG
jgi:hypothetical protein